MTMAESDPQLQLKKRARRRLVGAVAFAALAAIVLPMVMDQAPPAPANDVQIRIPGQDQVAPFNPKALAARSPEAGKPPVAALPELAPVAAAAKTPEPAAANPAEAPAAKAPEKVVEKPAVEKPAEKAPAKPAEKLEKPAAKPAPAAGSGPETQRAAAILAGKAAEPPAANGHYVILIGAFANTANVKQLQHKLGELGVKTYTEALDTPQGRKTRVRAGPFANRDAADKALDKMKRIGVTGIVAAKQ